MQNKNKTKTGDEVHSNNYDNLFNSKSPIKNA